MVANALSTLRGWLLGVLVLGLVGTGAELLLLEHYEDPWQLVPVCLIVFALAVLGWHRARPTAACVRVLQATMVMFLFAGGVGTGLHFDGAAEFQRESDPSISDWALVKKVMRVKAPPVLAPGIMVQLGLLGLVYAHRSTDQADSDAPLSPLE